MNGIDNTPGLSALAYRAGTHATFKAKLLAGLPRALGLTTREDDDPTMALLDAWATVLDVLTFYQERIANEGFLRTATERRSVLELARAIGYELNPGVAASTFLAFTLDDVPGSPAAITIAEGTKVQSIPGQDELPQLFETVESLDARASYNQLRPESSTPFAPSANTTEIFVRGIQSNVRTGDALLVLGIELGKPPRLSGSFRRVTAVAAVPPALPSLDPNAGYTSLTLDEKVGVTLVDPQVFVFRQRAALFGYNAPDWTAMSPHVKAAYELAAGVKEDDDHSQWPKFDIAYGASSTSNILYLDALYPRIAVDSLLVLTSSSEEMLFRVRDVSDAAMANFALTAKTTRVVLEGFDELHPKFGSLRENVVFAESERLDLAERPLTDPVAGQTITLDRLVDGLASGKLLAVTGFDVATAAPAGEVVALERTEKISKRTKLVLTTPLAHSYARDSCVILANVARATHGEGTAEILGSASASQPFTTFALKRKPLTYVPAPTPTGSESTLEVRVNGVSWTEVSSLAGQSSSDRVYTTRLDDDGTTEVIFGDGETGARPPSGQDNIAATYRVGLGTAGLLDAGQLSLLMSRPLGLRAVTNPVPASGAADAENLDEARQNAPRTVLTLDRIVSLQDFEDFTRGFAGIGKAQAAWVWNGHGQVVHITVAGVGGAEIATTSALYQNLLAAIDSARQTDQPIRIDSYGALSFFVEASVTVHPDYVGADVLSAVETALAARFSFEQQDFGQSVASSQVLALMQGVPGVLAVDLDALYLDGTPRALNAVLPSRGAYWANAIVPASLVTLAPGGALLSVGA